MKTGRTLPLRSAPAVLTGFGLLLASELLHAQTWRTVLDYHAGPNAGSYAMAADSSGNVFSGGDADDTSRISHGLVFLTDVTELAKADPAAISWLLSDDSNPDPAQYWSMIRDLACGASGRVYSAGSLRANCSGPQCPGSSWLLRMSSAAGAPGSWITLDSFQLAPGQGSQAYGVVEDPQGVIFVAGGALDVRGKQHGLVRKSVDGGRTWVIVDDVASVMLNDIHLAPNLGLFTAAHSAVWQVRRGDLSGNNWVTADQTSSGGMTRRIGHDAAGYVYAVGNITRTAKKTVYTEWTVRKWKSGLSSWIAEEAFVYPGSTAKSADAWDIATDAAGKPVIVGSATDAQGVTHWIVRRPDDAGIWQTVDDYQGAPGLGAAAGSIACDLAGNIIVGGEELDLSGNVRWTVRMFPKVSP
jgi:hypothetical protein